MPNKPKRIFLMQPFGREFDFAKSLVRDAVAELDDVEVMRADEIVEAGQVISAAIYNELLSADLLICDITRANPNVMYELGLVHALRKPVILMTQSIEALPFDLRALRVLIYRPDLESGRELIKQLRKAIVEALKEPEKFSKGATARSTSNNVFISYSHKDDGYLHRLLVHLRPLEKEGLIDYWVDTKLKAGDRWKKAIEEALHRARVAVLLISADFLASDFIVDNELPPLLAKAESDGTRIVPVILKPCRFARDKHLNRFQAINSPSKPLMCLSEGEQEGIYDKISEMVESFIAM